MVEWQELAEMIDRVKKEYRHVRWNNDDSISNLARILITYRDDIVNAVATQQDTDYGILDVASVDILKFANANLYKSPNLLTLIEEFAEMVLSARGNHDDPLRLELLQIASICLNLIRQLDAGISLSLLTEDIKRS